MNTTRCVIFRDNSGVNGEEDDIILYSLNDELHRVIAAAVQNDVTIAKFRNLICLL